MPPQLVWAAHSSPLPVAALVVPQGGRLFQLPSSAYAPACALLPILVVPVQDSLRSPIARAACVKREMTAADTNGDGWVDWPEFSAWFP